MKKKLTTRIGIYYSFILFRQNENNGNREAISMLGSPLDVLNGRIIDPNVKPTYRIIGTDVTSYKTIYNYSCTLYGLYGMNIHS